MAQFPRKHVETLQKIMSDIGPQPRYTIARELTRRVKGVSMATALDYLNSAVVERLLERIGDMLQLPEMIHLPTIQPQSGSQSGDT